MFVAAYRPFAPWNIFACNLSNVSGLDSPPLLCHSSQVNTPVQLHGRSSPHFMMSDNIYEVVFNLRVKWLEGFQDYENGLDFEQFGKTNSQKASRIDTPELNTNLDYQEKWKPKIYKKGPWSPLEVPHRLLITLHIHFFALSQHKLQTSSFSTCVSQF